MPYHVAEETFPNKSALTKRARLALKSTPDGQPVSETETEFLLSLFHHHNEWAEKSAGGVREITTQTTAHGTRCFVLRKHDANEVDISFVHAIRLLPSAKTVDILPQSLRDFKSAARSAIKSQIFDFRHAELQRAQSCPVTGEQLGRCNAAVDHKSPDTFDALLFKFCKEHGINPLEVVVGSIGGVVAAFEDKDLLHNWQSFHQSSANLRLVSIIGNLKLPKQRVAWAEFLA